MADDRFQHVPAGVFGAVQRFEDRLGFRADHVYGAALTGFAARLDDAQVAALAADPDVLYVEPDGIATAVAQTLPWGINHTDADVSSTLAGNGAGTITTVRAYIIDTGIDSGHTDLAVAGHVNYAGGANTDCNGHGTHVAGTVAARDNTTDVVGVAPGATLYGVKVLGCSGSGSWSGVISGIDWVMANAIKPAVANMSLGGGANTAVDDAVRSSAASGVFYALAAGNEGANACNSSPARVGAGSAITSTRPPRPGRAPSTTACRSAIRSRRSRSATSSASGSRAACPSDPRGARPGRGAALTADGPAPNLLLGNAGPIVTSLASGVAIENAL